MRRAIFKIAAPAGERFDGALSATVIIEQEGPYTLLKVRPYRRRREYVLHLSAVATQVIWRVAKAEDAERRKARKVARRGGAHA